MATAPKSYSDVVKKNIPNFGTELSNKENYNDDERDLVEKILELKQTVSAEQRYIKEKIEYIEQAVEKVRENNKKDRTEKQKEIQNLKERVFNLEHEIYMLRLTNVDAIDTGEAIKTIEMHVAAFVLPPGTTIAKSDGFGQIKKFAENNSNDTTSWKILQKQCGMKWQYDHEESKRELILTRNIEAHHKKFDLAVLTDAMIDQLPHYKKQCQDFVRLFKTVDSLLKFGMLASELCETHENAMRKRFSGSKEHIDLLHTIKNECYRRGVHYLQDIETEEAKQYLTKYFLEKDIQFSVPGLNGAINLIKEVNRPRLGQLVKKNEMAVASSLLQNPAKLTFDAVDKELSKGMTRKESVWKTAKRWKELTGGKEWSRDHSAAIYELKKMPAKKQSGEVDPLPIQIAQLHLPDFLDKSLWKAGSDILEIFEKWKKWNP